MESRKLSNEELEIITMLVIMSDEDFVNCYQDLRKASWVMLAINKHSLAKGLIISRKLEVVIHVVSDGVIGKAVKLLDHIQNWAKVNNCYKITLDCFLTNICPNGIPDLTNRQPHGA